MGWRSDLLQRLPPRVSLPVRSRLGFSREHEMKALDRFVRPGDHCVDIGCHLGIYSYKLLRLVGPHGSVVGFEPQDDLASYLEAAFAPHVRSGRFSVRRQALGDVPGQAILTLPLESGKINRGRATLRQIEGQTTTVPVVRLDAAGLRRPVSFVKCDVEGYELSVLGGGLDLLRNDAPTLLIEIEARHAAEQVASTFDLLWSLGYQAAVYREQDKTLGRIAAGDSDPAAVAAAWVGRYVNNFFFVPISRAESLAASRPISRK